MSRGKASRNYINKNDLAFPAAGTTGYIDTNMAIYTPDGGFHLLYDYLILSFTMVLRNIHSVQSNDTGASTTYQQNRE